ncbi:MgtC/SapB family protein [Candidatus Woesearchaeota archaeon]|jgi:putative Mg2+ transporter-C (MgtC) family protein|nr:MgtC/SapB family protein [Candidatus Woesearchaeota archaeon]
MTFTIEQVLQLVLAMGLSAIIGYEREVRKKPAGLRTNMLVCVGSTLVMIVATNYAGIIDPGRALQGIITGIGFLGAGTIIGSGEKVKGLTTAATLWVIACVGIALGLGYYFLALTVGALVIVILFLGKLEH